jgi:hypothetical protein
MNIMTNNMTVNVANNMIVNNAKYPNLLIKSNYGHFITIVLDAYFQEENIVESIIKTEDNTLIVVILNKNIVNSKLDDLLYELKVKDSVYLDYDNETIEISLYTDLLRL